VSGRLEFAESREELRDIISRDTDSVVNDSDLEKGRVVRCESDEYGDFTLLGRELNCVLQKIHENLLDAVLVAINYVGKARLPLVV